MLQHGGNIFLCFNKLKNIFLCFNKLKNIFLCFNVLATYFYAATCWQHAFNIAAYYWNMFHREIATSLNKRLEPDIVKFKLDNIKFLLSIFKLQHAGISSEVRKWNSQKKKKKKKLQEGLGLSWKALCSSAFSERQTSIFLFVEDQVQYSTGTTSFLPGLYDLLFNFLLNMSQKWLIQSLNFSFL